MKNKKDLLGGLIIIVLLLLILITYTICYNYKNEEDGKKELIADNSLSAIYIYEDNTFLKAGENEIFDNTKEILGIYNCKKDDCDIYIDKSSELIYDSKYVVIKENKKVFVYNFVKNKTVSAFYDDILFSLDNNCYVVKKDDKYGIISKAGLEIISPSYDEIVQDSIYDNKIKIKNNNLYGVLDLDNGKVLVDTKYENITITDSKYYSILKDGKWYVMESDKIITKGYDFTFAFNKGFITIIDNNLQILRYSEENEQLNKTIIPIFMEKGYKIERNGSIINIEIYKQDETITYEYNINRNNLTNK